MTAPTAPATFGDAFAETAARSAQTVLPAAACSDRTGSARTDIRSGRKRRLPGLLRRAAKARQQLPRPAVRAGAPGPRQARVTGRCLMRFEDISVDMAVRYVGCPPSVLSDDPLLAGRVTALWPDSFRVTFVHQRSYRYDTVAADMFEPLETVRDHTPSGGVIGVHAIDAMGGMGKSAFDLHAAQLLPAALSEDLAAAFHDDESAAVVGDRRRGSTSIHAADP
jgi:hypothetical protein